MSAKIPSCTSTTPTRPRRLCSSIMAVASASARRRTMCSTPPFTTGSLRRPAQRDRADRPDRPAEPAVARRRAGRGAMPRARRFPGSCMPRTDQANPPARGAVPFLHPTLAPRRRRRRCRPPSPGGWRASAPTPCETPRERGSSSTGCCGWPPPRVSRLLAERQKAIGAIHDLGELVLTGHFDAGLEVALPDPPRLGRHPAQGHLRAEADQGGKRVVRSLRRVDRPPVVHSLAHQEHLDLMPLLQPRLRELAHQVAVFVVGTARQQNSDLHGKLYAAPGSFVNRWLRGMDPVDSGDPVLQCVRLRGGER